MNSRELALNILYKVEFGEGYANIEIDKEFNKTDLIDIDKALATEIVYGVLIGVLTMIFRYMGFAEHCVLLALFISNFLCEVLDVLFLYLQIHFLRIRMIKK